MVRKTLERGGKRDCIRVIEAGPDYNLLRLQGRLQKYVLNPVESEIISRANAKAVEKDVAILVPAVGGGSSVCYLSVPQE